MLHLRRGEGFAVSNVNTVYPCVGWLVGVYEVGVAIATRSEGPYELEGIDMEGVFPRLASDMKFPLGSYLYPVTRKRRISCTRSAQVRAKSLSRVLSSRVITWRVARKTVSRVNAENGHSSAMWRVVSGVKRQLSKRQRSHAPLRGPSDF